MGRSDSERAPVLSAMLPSVSAWARATAPPPRNVADLTSPRTYAVSPDLGPDVASRRGREGGTWPLDGWEGAERGLSTVGRGRNVASRRLGRVRGWRSARSG